MMHRYALASKTLPSFLKEVLNFLIKIMLIMRFFSTAKRWLTKGNVVNRSFDRKEKPNYSCKGHKPQFVDCNNFVDNDWTARVAYLADIFDQINKVKLTLQRMEANILKL